jgi:hypothetical protein
MPTRTLAPVRPARLKAIDRTQELAWIAQHGREYRGESVVLDGNRLIGHGVHPGPLVERARSQGVERPLVTRIEDEPVASIGGWLQICTS